jgi:predicted nucleotidyltransferase
MRTLDKNLLETATKRLVAEFEPEQVWLYGSHAWGNPHDDSDVDLLVVVSHTPRGFVIPTPRLQLNPSRTNSTKRCNMPN